MIALAIAALLTTTQIALADGAEVGKPAPGFTLQDLDGNQVSLSDFKGKTVVLEWFNPDCPFVVYAHTDGPLAKQASKSAEDGVTWLAINSGAPGKQGHGVDRNRSAATEWSIEHPILMDESGDVGRLYGAKTTPEMYVVNPEGVLVYAGALDNAPRGRVEGKEVNFLVQALEDVAAGRPIQTDHTKPYGCSVKY